MDSVPLHCYNCRRPLGEADLQRGSAIQIGSLVSCEACAGELLDRLTPEQQRKILKRHAAQSSTVLPTGPARAAARGTHSSGTAYPRRGMTPFPAPAGAQNRTVIIAIAGVGGVLALTILFVILGGSSDPARERPRSRPVAAKPSTPPRPASTSAGSRKPPAPKPDAGLSSAVGALGREIRGMTDRHAYREAMDRLDRARTERTAFEWGTAVTRLGGDVETAMAARYERLKTEAVSAQKAGKSDVVKRNQDEVAAWGVAKYVEDLKKALVPEIPGLVGWWKLDGSGGDVVADASGRGRDGKLMGNPVRRAGEGLELDGDGDGVRIPRATHLEPAALTIMAWVKRNGKPDKFANIVRKTWKNNSGPTYASFSLQLNPNGRLQDGAMFGTGRKGGTDILGSKQGVLPDRTWVHLACTYDPAGAKPQKRIYINGAQNAAKPISHPLEYDRTSKGDLLLGQNGRGDEQLKGWVRDVRLYDRALTEQEIQAVYKAGAK